MRINKLRLAECLSGLALLTTGMFLVNVVNPWIAGAMAFVGYWLLLVATSRNSDSEEYKD